MPISNSESRASPRKISGLFSAQRRLMNSVAGTRCSRRTLISLESYPLPLVLPHASKVRHTEFAVNVVVVLKVDQDPGGYIPQYLGVTPL